MAIVAAIVIIAVLSYCGDLVVHKLVPSRFAANGRTTDTLVLCLMLIYTGAFAFLGGHIAATMARHNARGVGYVLGIALFLIAIGLQMMGNGGTPMWWNALSALVPAVAAIAGARSAPPQS